MWSICCPEQMQNTSPTTKQPTLANPSRACVSLPAPSSSRSRLRAMVMRSVVGKLKALTPRMPRFGAAPPKDMLGYQTPVIDPTKYDSLKELNEALPALLDKKFKAEREAYERYWKAYDRVTYVTAGASVGATIWFAIWFFHPLLKD